MLRKSPSLMRHVVTSLKVVAVATVLGTVVLAAERHLATQVSPEEIIATDMAPARLPGPTASKPALAAPAQQTSQPYFPSQFPEPTGEAAAEPSTF